MLEGEGLQLIISLIGSVGFPIVCCIMMWYQMLKQQNQHREEMSELKEVLVKNTEAINRLSEKLNK